MNAKEKINHIDTVAALLEKDVRETPMYSTKLNFNSWLNFECYTVLVTVKRFTDKVGEHYCIDASSFKCPDDWVYYVKIQVERIERIDGATIIKVTKTY